jgi:ferredoxin
MLKNYKQKEIIRKNKLPISPFDVHYIKTKEDTKTQLILKNGLTKEGYCVACKDPKCVKYSDSELELLNIKIPHDNNDNVCPFSAIDIDEDNGFSRVDSNHCIGCGICVNRCPFGALSIINNKAFVNVDLSIEDTTEEIKHPFDELVDYYQKVDRKGYIRNLSENNLQNVLGALNISIRDAQFPNILTRNLLMENAFRTIIRRKGDNIIRFDGISEVNGSFHILEIEFSKDVLEAPRSILDDLSVVSNKIAVNRSQFKPLIILNELPNKRAEYWRVIEDISNVLGVNIDTITIGMLFISLWGKLKITHIEQFMDYKNQTLRNSISKLLFNDREISINEGFMSILEPLK